jgi:hypothetical protein
MDSILENENKVKFRMYSDDDDLDYEGYWLDDIDADCELDPLDDFGMPNAGCTILRVLENGKWVMV